MRTWYPPTDGVTSLNLKHLPLGVERVVRKSKGLHEERHRGHHTFQPTLVNIYGEGIIEAYTPTEIVVAHQDRPFGIHSVVGWGESPGEFMLYRNGEVVGGLRTSDQQRAMQIDYSVSPIMFSDNDILSVVVEHGSMGYRTMRVNVLGKYF